MGIFHSYVSLPEGNFKMFQSQSPSDTCSLFDPKKRCIWGTKWSKPPHSMEQFYVKALMHRISIPQLYANTYLPSNWGPQYSAGFEC